MTLAHNGRCPKINIGTNSEQISTDKKTCCSCLQCQHTVTGSNEPVQHDVTRKLCPASSEKLNIVLHPETCK